MQDEGNLVEADPSDIVNEYMNNNPHLQDMDKADTGINTSNSGGRQREEESI